MDRRPLSLRYFSPQNIVLRKIKNYGGWVNTHAHLDRAYTLTSANYPLTATHLHEKWTLVNEIKKQSTVDHIYDRMAYAVEYMIRQEVQAIGTFIDVDEIIKDRSIKAASRIKEKYINQIKIKFINGSTYKGLLDKKQREWFDMGSEFVDIIGGLPAIDKGHEEQHIEIVLEKASRMKKMAHFHVDQLNTPLEKETELLAKKTIEYKMEGKVVAVHGVSISAHPKAYRKHVYTLMKKAGLMLICCPLGWIDHRRREDLVPSHNSIAPVEELVKAGIIVALGTDNIHDIYKPFLDGDIWTELRFLLEALHFYDIDALAKIGSINGLRTLGIM